MIVVYAKEITGDILSVVGEDDFKYVNPAGYIGEIEACDKVLVERSTGRYMQIIKDYTAKGIEVAVISDMIEKIEVNSDVTNGDSKVKVVRRSRNKR